MSSNILDRTPNPDSEFGFQLGNHTIGDIPELTNLERFRFSAEDVWRWAQTLTSQHNTYSLVNKVMKRDPQNAKYIKKNGLPDSELDEICSLREHTKRLIDRFSSWLRLQTDPNKPNLDLPIDPESPLMKGVAKAVLERLEDILWYLVSTDRHAGRDRELYKVACGLRLYSETLDGITKDVGGRHIGHLTSGWVVEICQKLAELRDEIARISEVARSESIPLDWRKTVEDVGDLASKVVATVLDASGNVKITTWAPDKDSLELIREAIPQIRKWSEEFSIQADCPPANSLPPFPHIDLLAVDAERQCVLSSTAIERMDETKRILRLSRDRILNSQVIAPATHDLKAICRKYLTEVTNHFNLQSDGTFSHRVPHLPNICDEVSALQFLGDLDCWLAKSILELRAERPSDTSTPALAAAPAVNSEQPPSPAMAAATPIAERDAPAGESKGRGGRPSFGESTKPSDIAKLNIYRLIRKQKQANPKSGPRALLRHFKEEKGFKDRLAQAGLKLDKDMFIAAIRWITRNPS